MKHIHKTIAIFFVCSLLEINTGSGQTVLLQVDRQTDSIPTNRGPNLEKFSHAFFFVGFVAGTDKPGAPVVYGPSVEFGGGARKKYKLSSLYSMGWELGLSEKIFKLKQELGKTVPDSTTNEVERMEFTSINLAFYNRINFDTHRGNYLGTYLDLGIGGEWDFDISHIVKNTLPDGSHVKSVIDGLPYVNHFNYNVFSRFGKNHFSVYASFRLSKLFKSSYGYGELPALRAGIELSVFRQ